MNDIKTKICNIVNNIESGRYSPRQLRTLYENVIRYEGTSEEQAELVASAVEKCLRLLSAGDAQKLFGSKDAQGRKILQDVYERSCVQFDLGNNLVGLGVKTGGDMIAGRSYVDAYISYKNAEKWHLGFGYVQQSVSSDPYFRVRLYRGGAGNPEGCYSKEFSVADQKAAEAAYFGKLKELVR
jgi:hypothetical protein